VGHSDSRRGWTDLLAPFPPVRRGAPVNAAFTRPARWKLDDIEQTYAGSWCCRPGASSTLRSGCSNSTLKVLLDAHIKNDYGAGLSIAYYDLTHGSAIGGASWASWDTIALPVGVCMSGQVDGLEAYTTTCRFSIADNDHGTPSSHLWECADNRPQLRVADGCYMPPPDRPWLRLDDSTSVILATISFILALPIFGLYRQYQTRRARQETKVQDEQAQPLIGLEGGVVDEGVSQNVSPLEPQRIES